MATTCYLTFPASEIKTATDSIFYAIARYVIGKFPQRVIKQMFVDTQDNMRDFYKNAISSYNGNISDANDQELLKTPRPHMFVGYQMDSSFETTETGLLETQPYMLPNAFFFQDSMQSQHPILHDTERNIYLATNNLRIRSTAEFVITCKSREEQFTIYNYLLNFIKMYYTMPIEGIKASYILPTYMMSFIKDILYGEDTKYETIASDMDEYLKKWSNGGIYPVYRNNRSDDKFYEMQYVYRRIDFKLTGKPQIDDGNKTNDAADNFTIRFPATVEFYIPTNYTIRTPELIPNCCGGASEVPDAIKIDSVSEDGVSEHVQTIIKRHDDGGLMRKSFLKEDGWTLARSVEFCITSPNDSFNLIDCLDENNTKILKKLIEEKRTDLYKFFLYEDKYIVDEDTYYTIDDNFNITVKDGDVTKIYTFELYYKGQEILEFFNIK